MRAQYYYIYVLFIGKNEKKIRDHNKLTGKKITIINELKNYNNQCELLKIAATD